MVCEGPPFWHVRLAKSALDVFDSNTRRDTTRWEAGDAHLFKAIGFRALVQHLPQLLAGTIVGQMLLQAHPLLNLSGANLTWRSWPSHDLRILLGFVDHVFRR